MSHNGARGRSTLPRRLRSAWNRRLVRLLAVPAVNRLVVRLAWVYRGTLVRPVVVGVTGSSGKTTTKDLTAAVLASRARGTKSVGSSNDVSMAARTLLKTLPWHGHAVVEVAASGPGTVGPIVRLLRPRIGIVTNIGSDHFKAFRTPDATATEKGRLVDALPAGGTAILNVDDPRVRAMRARCAGRVVTFGLDPAADVRAVDVAGVWPERLSFTVLHGAQALPVRTRLCGTHWVPNVLAALAAGLAAGVPLADGVRAVAGVEPWMGRMSPVALPDGVTFIRDDWKASLGTIAPALAFLREAHARRKIAVIGTLSDYGGTASAKYVAVARAALGAADRVIFVGRNASRCLRAAAGASPGKLLALGTVREAADYLRETLEPGDLVLLKGSNPADHLIRILLARTGPIACWRSSCGKKFFCDTCPLLNVAGDPDPVASPASRRVSARGAEAA